MINRLFTFFLFLVFTQASSQVIISEFQASNTAIFDTLHGNANDWLELYNTSTSEVDLSGWFLSDDSTKKSKWAIPSNTKIAANTYLLFWCDKENTGLHTSFGLSSGGEHIALSNKDTSIVDYIEFGDQTTNVSMGRVEFGSTDLVYFTSATPGAVNAAATSTVEYSIAPEVSITGGFYTSTQNVELTSQNGASLYYTLDGSIPTISSFVYSSALEISETTCLKVIAVEAGKFPSEVITNTYFINENSTLPVVSLTGNPDYLWDDYIGIYTVGKNGASGYGATANFWNRNWEREMNFEYFENKTKLVSSGVGIEINGQRRNMAQKSLKLNFRGKYGNSEIKNEFFDHRSYGTTSSLLLRNGGFNDYSYSIIRDVLAHEVVRDLDLDIQEYKRVNVFINGEYFGIYNIREKQDDNYIKSIHGQEDIDMIEYQYEDQLNLTANEGSLMEWEKFHSYLVSNDLSKDDVWKVVEGQMDISSFIDYTLTEMYLTNIDWPSNNLKFWKSSSPKSKWRPLLFGTEAGMGHWNGANMIRHITDTVTDNWNKAKEVTLIFNKLLQNQSFKNRFIGRMDLLLNTSFSESNMLDHLGKHVKIMQSEVPRHIAKWGSCDVSIPEEADGCAFKSLGEWNYHLSVIQYFIEIRPDSIIQHFKDYFNLSGRSRLTVSTNNLLQGKVEVNRYVVTKNAFTGEFFNDVPVTIKAIPKAGYRFVEWVGLENFHSDSISIKLSADLEIEAVFEATGESIIPNSINSDYTLSLKNSPYIADGDIIVQPNVTLTIEEGVEIKVSENTNFIVYGAIEANGVENNPIRFMNNVDAGASKWRALNFFNTTDTTKLTYVVLENASYGVNASENIAAISCHNAQLILNNLEITNVYENPIFGRESYVILENSKIRSKITGDLINIKKGELYIRNCTFLGSDRPDTDAIDFDGIENGEVKNCNIYGFYGSNSDAIDLGEQSKNILIEGNTIFSCTDKGVSVGQASTGIIKNNIIYACSQAVGIKDEGSYALIDKNTFDNNHIGVACFEKNANRGGGTADIKNTIISNSISSTLFVDEFGEATVNYSLSTNEALAGDHNVYGDPMFKNWNIANYNLKVGSKAIDAGDPNSDYDDDNTITDIGALSRNDFTEENKSVVINEIMSNNTSVIADKSGAFEDWVEIYNPNAYSVNIAGYYFTDDFAQQTLWQLPDTAPQKTIVPPYGHLLFWADNDTEEGGEHLGFKLSALGERVGLSKDVNSELVWVDSVSFGALEENTSYGRMEDGNTYWTSFTKSSPYASNTGMEYFFVTNANANIEFNTPYYYKFQVNQNSVSFEVIGLPEGLVYDDNGDGTGQISGIVINESQAGVYQVTINAYDGVFKVASQSFLLNLLISDLETEEGLVNNLVYPNPVQKNGVLHFDSVKEGTEVEFISVDGEVLYRTHVRGAKAQISGHLSTGVYLARFTKGKGISVLKVMVL